MWCRRNWMRCTCIVPHRVVTTGSWCHWYLLLRSLKHKPITANDTYNTILQVGTQIETVPQLMLSAVVMACENILWLWWVYWILMWRRWGWVSDGTVRWAVDGAAEQTPDGAAQLHKTVSTDWYASR